MQEALERVQQHVTPACSFLIEYLSLFADNAGLGGMSVYFGDSELHGPATESRMQNLVRDEIEQLAEQTKMQTARMRRFCALLRRFSEGSRRCWNCDVSWIARAERTKRTQVYQCHAGLTDIVVPIVVRGEYVGRILTGQLFQPGRLRGGFDDIWNSVKDVGDLEREELEETCRELASVSNAELRAIVRVLENAARTLGDLWENMTALLEQEKQLLRMHVYLEREFADWLVSGRNFSMPEALARAKAIGLSELPTAVIVAQPDLASQAAFEMDSIQKHQAFVNLVEAMHRVSGAVPDSLVVSMQPGEIVLLWHLPKTRNPELRRLRSTEMAARIVQEAKRYSQVPVLIGVSMNSYSAGRMDTAYREARTTLNKRDDEAAFKPYPGESNGEWLARFRRELVPILLELRDAVARDDRQAVGRVFEMMLRMLNTCPAQDCDARRLLFTEMVYCFLDGLRETRCCETEVERIKLDYMRSFSGLRTMEDITGWFRSALAGTVFNVEAVCMSPEERAVAQACVMVGKGLGHTLNRKQIALAVGMSESHFGAVFHNVMGVPFREYVQLARIAQAQRLLLEPGKSVSEVAGDVGYADMSSFSRAFARTCGVSPTIYRRSPRAHKPVTVPRKVCATQA